MGLRKDVKISLVLLIFIIGIINFGSSVSACSPQNCDDGNACTIDECVEGGGCVNTPIVCDDGVSCTVDSCNEQTGCVYTPDDSLCEPGDQCGDFSCDVQQGCVFNEFPDETGPVTSDLTAVKVVDACKIKIDALETDQCSAIAEAEYFLGGATCGAEGSGNPLNATDGLYNSLVEAVTKSGVGTQDGSINVHVRGQDVAGNWGDCETIRIDVDCLPPFYPTCEEGDNLQHENGIKLNDECNPEELLVCGDDPIVSGNVCDDESRIQAAEYFIDEDNPINWRGIPMTASDGSFNERCEDVEATIDLDDLSEGTHYVQLHGKDGQENWGKFTFNPIVSFIKDTVPPVTEKKIDFADEVSFNCDYTTANGNALTDGCYYVKPGTEIWLSAEDPDTPDHEISDNPVINWRIWFSEDCTVREPVWTLKDSGQGLPNEDVHLNLIDDSCHLIEYWASDGCTNEERHHFELDIVDALPPITKKEVGEPKVACEENGNGGDNINGENGNNEEHNSPGDLLRDITMSDDVGAFSNVGVAFDGTVLYVPDETTVIKLINPDDGSEIGELATSPAINLGAMGYDAKRNVIWACSNGVPNKLYKLELNGDVTLIETLPGDHFHFCDGLAYDENDPNSDSDDRIWFSRDVGPTVYELNLTGSVVDSFAPGIPFGNSGIAVGGEDLYLANNGGDKIFRFDKDSKTNLGEFSAPGDRPEDLECDDATFPVSAIWVRMFENNHLKAYEIEEGTCGIGGQPPEPQDGQCDWFITQQTPITLSCADQEPHPIDDVTLYWRDYLEGSRPPEYWVEEDGEVTIYKEEDSRHVLEWYCVDALGNSDGTAEEPHREIDIVDSVPPKITKEIVGPSYGQCPPKPGSQDVCYIDGVTEIHVSVEDPQPHPVNDVTCEWSYTVNGGNVIPGDDELGSEFIVQFPEESSHNLVIECEDALGNRVVDEETFIVDKTPPVTTKSFDGPYFTCQDWCRYEAGEDGEALELCLKEMCEFDEEKEEWFPAWISSETAVYLDGGDQAPHPSGISETFWRNTLVDDENCLNQDVCQQAVGRGEWNTYHGIPFYKTEESCHLIEYYSVDNVEKTERVNKQCVFVDNTAPLTDKEVGEPKYPCVGDEELCGPQGEWPAWFVTGETPITLSCKDGEPHPVDHESLCYRISWDDDNQETPPFLTEQYCKQFGGEIEELYSEESQDWVPFCCSLTEEDGYGFNFQEDSLHNIEWFCRDALGNVGEANIEWDNVDSAGPEIIIRNPNSNEREIEMCVQKIVASIDDEKSGVIRAWAELWATPVDEGDEPLREIDLNIVHYGQTVTWEGIMNKELPAGDYILKVCAEDGNGNENCKEVEETLLDGIFVEFITPAICGIDPEEGGICDFTYNICMRGDNSIKFWLNKIEGLVTPGDMNAIITNPETGESATVGLRHESGLTEQECGEVGDFWDPETGLCWFITDAEFLQLQCSEINGRTEFELHLELDSEDMSAIGPGVHELEYWIESLTNICEEPEPECVPETEVCDDSIDNDCDGDIDIEDLDCE